MVSEKQEVKGAYSIGLTWGLFEGYGHAWIYAMDEDGELHHFNYGEEVTPKSFDSHRSLTV